MRKFVLAVLFLIGVTSWAGAKVYWLPDFVQDPFGSRVQGSTSGPHTSSPSCSTYGLQSAPQTNASCTRRLPAPGLTCYSCSCPSKFQYTSSNCSGDNKPSGNSCMDRYESCTCDPAKFPYTSCQNGYSLGGKSCRDTTDHYEKCINDCDGLTDQNCGEFDCKKTYDKCPTKCEVCYTDNCHIRTAATTNFSCPAGGGYAAGGCKEYWSDCSSKCKTAFGDCCHARPDNTTDYGCDNKYWQDCPSKCEIGKTCTPTDCSGFPLTTVPANASFSECVRGCKDNTKHYKITSCNTGFAQTVSACGTVSNGQYYLEGSGDCRKCNVNCNNCYAKNGSTCTPVGCTTGYASSTAGCGTAPANGYWALGAQDSCYSANKCQKCEQKCNTCYVQNGSTCTPVGCTTGYASSAANCGSAPTNGYWTLGVQDTCYSANQCKRCEKICNPGFVQTVAACGTVSHGQYYLEGSGDCKKCSVKCNTGYAQTASACGSAPANGYWELSGSGTCKECVRKCNDGYVLSGTTCVLDKCRDGYAHMINECGWPVLNGQWVLGATDSSNPSCKMCVIQCSPGYVINEALGACVLGQVEQGCWSFDEACSMCGGSVRLRENIFGQRCHVCCTGGGTNGCLSCLGAPGLGGGTSGGGIGIADPNNPGGVLLP